MQSYERVSPMALFNAIFFGVVGIIMLIAPIPSALAWKADLWPWSGVIYFLAGFVTLFFSVFFFWAYRQDKRFEKEKEEDETRRVLASEQEDKIPAEANRR